MWGPAQEQLNPRETEFERAKTHGTPKDLEPSQRFAKEAHFDLDLNATETISTKN